MNLYPSRPQLVIRVGVTGHREGSDLGSEALREAIQKVLAQIGSIALEAFLAKRQRFAKDPNMPILRLVSSLAQGADRLVAQEATAKEYKLHALLPFPRGIYAKDPNLGSLDEFNDLLDDQEKTERVFELDNSSATEAERKAAYEAAGRLVLRQSDILIAIWDGEPARGMGGTGQIVEEAQALEIPVLRIDSNLPHGITLLNSKDSTPGSGFPGQQLRERLLQILIPQAGVVTERLLPLEESKKWREASELPANLSHEGDAVLRTGFIWADKRAKLFAFLYRLSYRSIYVLGAVAVLFAYLGSTAELHRHRVYLSLELAAILVILFLTLLGWLFKWHRQWLDYRHLAESLRATRISALLGRVASHSPVPAKVGGELKSSKAMFYLRSFVSQAGLVTAVLDEPYRDAFRAFLHENVVDQIRYHRRTAERCHRNHKRWHMSAQALFVLAAIACGLHFLVHEESTDLRVRALNFAVIVLPAFGGAIGALLHHGESERIKRLSEGLAEHLEVLRGKLLADLGRIPSSQELASLTDEFSTICLAELMDWRFLFLDRPLVLPA